MVLARCATWRVPEPNHHLRLYFASRVIMFPEVGFASFIGFCIYHQSGKFSEASRVFSIIIFRWWLVVVVVYSFCFLVCYNLT